MDTQNGPNWVFGHSYVSTNIYFASSRDQLFDVSAIGIDVKQVSIKIDGKLKCRRMTIVFGATDAGAIIFVMKIYCCDRSLIENANRDPATIMSLWQFKP
jgi:hypothetical protein